MTPRRPVLAVALSAAAFLAVVAPAAAAAPCPCDHAGYTLVFDEPFDRLRLQADGGPGVWSTTGDGNNAFQVGNRTLPHEQELYTDAEVMAALHLPPDNDPFKVSGGILSITAAPLPPAAGKQVGLAYSSGLLTTRNSFRFRYGYMEVRAKIPSGRGLWPAIWLYRPEAPYAEIDLLEVLGHEPGRAYSTIHFGTVDTDGKPVVKQTLVVDRKGPDLSADFHVYAVDWTEKTIRFLIDGTETGRADTPAALKGPLYILLNLAVGGPGSWPGPVDASTRFPATFAIDSVRVWTAPGQVQR